MALKATIHKAELQITDLDRHYYADHALTIARHPSETDERMMVRIIIFALHASESLQFTKGLSSDDEPDIWQRSLSDEIELWIELGHPDEKRMRRACGRARQVVVYSYQQQSGDAWWQQHAGKFSRFDNLSVYSISDETVAALGQMAARSMRLQCTIQDGQLFVTDGERSLEIAPQCLKSAK